MVRILGRGLVGVSVFAIMALTSCQKYPECSTDEECSKYATSDDPAVASQARLTPYCVNKTCQQCRGDADCPRGSACNANRCERIPGYCDGDRDCPSPQICISNRCQIECNGDSECKPGFKCEGNRCVPGAECSTDDDCPSGKRCMQGQCIPAPPQSEQKAQCFQPIYFDFDRYDIRSDAASTLQTNAECLKALPAETTMTVEGHCDERGTEEYNLSLGEKRANAAKNYLKDLGVDKKRLKSVSYGETRPVDARSNEEAWEKNRRAEFTK